MRSPEAAFEAVLERFAERDARVAKAAIDAVAPRLVQAGADAVVDYFAKRGQLLPDGHRAALVRRVVRDEAGRISEIREQYEAIPRIEEPAS